MACLLLPGRRASPITMTVWPGPANFRKRSAVARRAREVALATLSGGVAIEVAIVDRAGEFLARTGGFAE